MGRLATLEGLCSLRHGADSLYLEMLLRSLCWGWGTTRTSRGQWQMPSKHCSPQEPPLAMWSSVRSAQAAGSSHQGTSAASCGAVQAGGCGQRGSRKFRLCLPCLLVAMPCSISKRAWVLRVCLSSDRRQPPRESRPSFPGPPPGSHTPPNAAWWEQADDQKAGWEHPRNWPPLLPLAVAFHKGAHLDTPKC